MFLQAQANSERARTFNFQSSLLFYFQCSLHFQLKMSNISKQEPGSPLSLFSRQRQKKKKKTFKIITSVPGEKCSISCLSALGWSCILFQREIMTANIEETFCWSTMTKHRIEIVTVGILDLVLQASCEIELFGAHLITNTDCALLTKVW